jgi:hypothetical protein
MDFPKSRFVRSEFRGRCRQRLLTGLLLMVVATAYGTYAGRQFAHRGRDTGGFDRPVMSAARALTPAPYHMRWIQPENNRELYLVTVISDQQDVMFGLTLFLLRMIATVTVGGLGVVLVAGGSSEWEVRSQLVT